MTLSSFQEEAHVFAQYTHTCVLFPCPYVERFLGLESPQRPMMLRKFVAKFTMQLSRCCALVVDRMLNELPSHTVTDNIARVRATRGICLPELLNLLCSLVIQFITSRLSDNREVYLLAIGKL